MPMAGRAAEQQKQPPPTTRNTEESHPVLANSAFLIRMRGVPMWSVCENTLPQDLGIPLDLRPMPTPPKKESKKLPLLKWSQSLQPQTLNSTIIHRKSEIQA